MLKKTISYLFISCLIVTETLYSQDQYILVNPSFDEGTSINISIEVDAPDGVLLQQIGDEKKQGSMSVSKNYQLERKTIATITGLETKISYNIVSVQTDVKIHYDGESTPHVTNINLTDIQVMGDKNKAGEWQFSIEGNKLTPDIEALMLELQAYENREWFSNKSVKVGDSWKIYPAFTDFLITRDLQNVETEGTMKLLNVSRKGENNVAILNFSATSKGWGKDKIKGARNASFNTQGLLHYSLDQQLDTNLIITSQLESFVQNDDSTVSVVLPFTYKVQKSIVQ